MPTAHIAKAAYPHEAIRVIQVAEGAQDVGSVLVLRLNETLLKERNQGIALAAVERVLTELKHLVVVRGVGRRRIRSFLREGCLRDHCR